MKERFVSPERLAGEEVYDRALRPKLLSEFVGQERIKQNLRVFTEAARARAEALDHVLLFGPSGLGKTTLAHIIANELGVEIKATTGPVLERPADLAGILTSLGPRDLFFIDEVHRTPRVVEEFLYPALEDFCLEILIDRGPGARSEKIPLNPFTLVGATTRSGLLSAPFRARFGITFHLDYYPVEELAQIVHRSASILKVTIDEPGAWEIARRARGTPRIANRLLRRVRDFAQVMGRPKIDEGLVRYALAQLEIDEQGLDEMDHRILHTLIEKFGGGPVGIGSLAMAVGEDPETLEEVYEPYLVHEGFVKRTPRGREATELAYEHLGLGQTRLRFRKG